MNKILKPLIKIVVSIVLTITVLPVGDGIVFAEEHLHSGYIALTTENAKSYRDANSSNNGMKSGKYYLNTPVLNEASDVGCTQTWYMHTSSSQYVFCLNGNVLKNTNSGYSAIFVGDSVNAKLENCGLSGEIIANGYEVVTLDQRSELKIENNLKITNTKTNGAGIFMYSNSKLTIPEKIEFSTTGANFNFNYNFGLDNKPLIIITKELKNTVPYTVSFEDLDTLKYSETPYIFTSGWKDIMGDANPDDYFICKKTNYKVVEYNGELGIEYDAPKVNINSVSFDEPVVPVEDAAPSFELTGVGNNYTANLVWEPADSVFGADKVYTAVVTLTASKGYQFIEGTSIPNGWSKRETTSDKLVITKQYGPVARTGHYHGNDKYIGLDSNNFSKYFPKGDFNISNSELFGGPCYTFSSKVDNHFYLKEDIVLDRILYIPNDADVSICLNGHKISSTNIENGQNNIKDLIIATRAKLTIFDENNNGEIVNDFGDTTIGLVESDLIINGGKYPTNQGQIMLYAKDSMSNAAAYSNRTININNSIIGTEGVNLTNRKGFYFGNTVYLECAYKNVSISNTNVFGSTKVINAKSVDVTNYTSKIENVKIKYTTDGNDTLALYLSNINDYVKLINTKVKGTTSIQSGSLSIDSCSIEQNKNWDDVLSIDSKTSILKDLDITLNVNDDHSSHAPVTIKNSEIKIINGKFKSNTQSSIILSGNCNLTVEGNPEFISTYTVSDTSNFRYDEDNYEYSKKCVVKSLSVPVTFRLTQRDYFNDLASKILFYTRDDSNFRLPYLYCDEDTYNKISIVDLHESLYSELSDGRIYIGIYYIDQQPSYENSNFSVTANKSELVTYQWHKVLLNTSEVTEDDNLMDGACYKESEKVWVPNVEANKDFGMQYTKIHLNKGDVINLKTISIANDTNLNVLQYIILDLETFSGDMAALFSDDIYKETSLVAQSDGDYYIFALAQENETYDFVYPEKLRITKRSLIIGDEIEGQTSNIFTGEINATCKVSWHENEDPNSPVIYSEYSDAIIFPVIDYPTFDFNTEKGIITINSNAINIEKAYIYKAKDGINAKAKEDATPGYYTIYKNLTNDGTNFKTYVASDKNPIANKTTLKFEEAGQYILRIKYTNEGETKYSSFVIEVKPENIKNVEPKMTPSLDGKFAVLDLNGCENIQKLYVGYAQTSNVNSTIDYTVYSNFISTAESYKIESNVKDNKQFVLDRPGYSYVFRIKYQDLDGTSKYVAYTFECPTKQNLQATTAYLDINKNTINVVMEDGRAIDSIKLLSNDKEVTSNSNKTSINAPFNGNYKVVVTDVAGFDYSFNADISLTSLGEIKDLEALSRLKTKINNFLTKVSSTESNIIRVGDEKDYLAINSVARQTLTDEITNKVNPILNNSSSYNQKQITEAYNSLNNAFNLFLTKLQVNVLSVTGNSNDGYSITIADGSDEIKIDTVYVKGSSTDIDGNSKSQGIFLEDYADFVSVGKHEALTPGQTTTRLPGVYTVRYKVKLNMIVGVGDEAQVIDNEFRAASYLMLLDGSSELNDVTKFLESNVYDGLDMYRKAVNLGFAENIEDPSKNKQFAADLETALTTVDANLITENRGTNEANEMVISTSNPSELEFTRPTFENTTVPVQVSINYILNIREKLSDMPKLSDNASKTLYKSYLYGTNSKVVTGAEFDEGDFLNPEHTTVVKGNEDKKDDVKKLDNPTITLNADTKYVRIGVNNISNVRVAFGDFDKNSSWTEFSSVPYSTYYDSVFNYTPKWNGKYTVRIKYFDNSYEYLHFTVTGAPDPIKEIIKGKDSFKIVAADGYAIDSVLYAYSGIGDNNYWPATNGGDNTFTALALGSGEHMFKIRAEFQGSLNEYYVKDSGFEPGFNEYQPVVVNYTDGDKTIVGIYSDSKNTLSVVYGNLGETSSWDDIQKIDGITYTTKNGAISLNNAEGLVKFAFALKDNNIVIKDVGTSSNSEN